MAKFLRSGTTEAATLVKEFHNRIMDLVRLQIANGNGSPLVVFAGDICDAALKLMLQMGLFSCAGSARSLGDFRLQEVRLAAAASP